MKLLANENFPYKSIFYLKSKGYDITSIGMDNPSIKDSEIMTIAMAEERTILTFDRDYGELIFRNNYKPEKGVIYLRLDIYSPEEPGLLIEDLLNNKEFDSTRALTVLDKKAFVKESTNSSLNLKFSTVFFMFVPYYQKMKKIATIILSSLFIASTLVGCMKEEAPAKEIVPIPNDLGKVSRLSLFPNWFGEQIQSQTYRHSNGTVFTGNRGTIITVQANAFVTEDNQSVSGDVRIFLLELYNKKDMIMSNILPTSGGAQLVSGGEIYVEAQNSSGTKLKLAPGKVLNVKMPAGNNPSSQMQLFTAAEINQNADWNLAQGVQVNVVALDTAVSTQGGFAYDFSSTTLGWLNCDYFWNSTDPQTAIKATVASQFNPDNCLVIVSFNGLNAASRFWSYNASNNQFSPGGSYTLPIGLPVHFVAIAEINQQYYFADENATIVNNHNQSLDLNPVTLDSIQVALGNLP